MRLIFFALSVVVLLLVAVIVGPSFVDWNKYKPQIIGQVKSATGFDVQIGGDLSLSVLPSPRVKVSDIVVASPKKIQFENLLSMKTAEVSVALMPLLQKQVEVKSVTLVEPDIQIEMMQDGTPSWTTEKIAAAKEVSNAAPQEMKQDVGQAAEKALESISLDKLEIKNGKLSFIDHKAKARHSADDIDVVLKAKSLKGPFEVEGSLNYDGKEITLEVKTDKLPTKGEALSLQAVLGVPEAKSGFTFNGVAAIQQPYDVQGQTTIKIESPAKLASLFGSGLGKQYDQALMLDGLLSADQNKVSYDDLKLSFGSFSGNGKLSIQDLKTKNPLRINGSIKSSSTLDIDPFLEKSSGSGSSGDRESLKNAGKSSSAKSDSFVPQSLTLPMPMDVDVKLDMAGVKVKGHQLKGIFVDLKKKDATSKVTFKALELPGQGKADGSLNIFYSSSSKSPKIGQVVYSDPSVSYQVNGQAGQLAAFLKAFAPDADTSAVTKLYKTAQFNLKGTVNRNTISLKDSTLKLDQMVLGLGGRYQPASGGKRAKAVIDLTAGSVDFDRILATKGGKKTPANDNGGGAAKGSAKEALKPVQGLSLPMDMVFDISLQKARINQADLEGLRLTGDLTGKKLTLKNASVNNFAGAAMSLKGQVANLSDLSGLDLSFYTKTSDVQRLTQALKVDASKLPKGVKALEANVTGKGQIDKLVFSSNIKALGGQLDAAGNAYNVLDKPSFDDLSVGIKHSNAVKAIQIFNPSFKGAAGLQQPLDFYTKANIQGKSYDLSDMKVKLGATSFNGNLKIDVESKIPSIRGNIQAGKIALDSLLGAKKSAKSSGGSSGGSGGSMSTTSSARWSKTSIDLSWMKTMNVDMALAASSLTYGAWNFTQPSTNLKIANGEMNVEEMKAGVFGGQANLTTQVKAEPVSLAVASRMNNIDLESLAKALSGGNKLKGSGKVSFTTDVNSTGGSSHALINALNGSAALDGANVILKGFDLSKLARGLAIEEKFATSIGSLIDGATSGGQTKFDTVKGDYKIQNGTVNIQSMVMDGPEAVINTTGYADLPKWFINADNEITLKNVPDLKPFNVKIKGPINNPSDTFGKNILEDYFQDKIKRKIGKELPGLIGDDASNVLEGLGIIPKQEAPAPAPAEGAAQPAEQQPQAQPAQQQEQQQEIDPEDALKDVLKGLF